MQVTLSELLDSRERRVQTQMNMIKEHRLPLVCFTMNVAGPVKTSPLIERAFDEGVRLIAAAVEGHRVAQRREECTVCGPVFFASVDADAEWLKTRLTEIEEGHPLGRLFDMDVIDAEGKKLSRRGERSCMICGAPGRACARERAHPVSDLVAYTEKKLTDYFVDSDSGRIARLARESLLAEVYTEPKPGLVDPHSRGSHSDMGIAEFERSAEALEPYFASCVRLGFECKNEPDEVAFSRLRELGLSAERDMYSATGGVNTHKGIVFSMGIITAAVGRLMRPDGYIPATDAILAEATRLSRPTLMRDLEGIDGSTAGGRAYIEHGERGIRGEVMDGFPSLRNIAIPTYRAAIREGKNKNDAGALTLLHLIAEVFDTSLYKRGGISGVEYARDYARSLLSGEPTKEALLRMDVAFTERNLSPGGSADLLAITYFLLELEGAIPPASPICG